MAIPHPDSETFSVKCAVITVSDTRTRETDRSGQLIQQSLKDAGHEVMNYCILPDEPEQIKRQLTQLSEDCHLNSVQLKI